jgi:hypothetical protein
MWICIWLHMASYGPHILTPLCSAGPKPVFFSLWRSLEADVFASIMINYALNLTCANPGHAKAPQVMFLHH